MRNSKLSLETVEALRAEPGRSVLLFLTDRCPVGCAHCSVSSTREAPTITDFHLFRDILDGLCRKPGIELVGISGGEPFVERSGLMLAVETLRQADKLIVVYTSGVWARGGQAPSWVRSIIADVQLVFLSFDAFHSQSINDSAFVCAAATVINAGTTLVVQVLNEPGTLDRAVGLLQAEFGTSPGQGYELNLIPPLPYGRGADVFRARMGIPVGQLGHCKAVAAGVVRYDGRVSACCNEQVIMGAGPAQLSAQCRSGKDVVKQLDEFRDDPLLTVLSQLDAVTLCEHPALNRLGDRKFANICEFCWAAQDILGGRRDALLHGLAVLGKPETVATDVPVSGE